MTLLPAQLNGTSPINMETINDCKGTIYRALLKQQCHVGQRRNQDLAIPGSVIIMIILSALNWSMKEFGIILSKIRKAGRMIIMSSPHGPQSV